MCTNEWGMVMKTLIVDDELVSRTKLKKILQTAGECTACATGREAIIEFEQELDGEMPYDLVTLDISMLGMDGLSVLLILRNAEKKRRIPAEKRTKIFMVSSHSSHDKVINAIQNGCNGYIIKPFNRETIEAQLRKAGLLNGQVTEAKSPPEKPDKELISTKTNGQPPPKGFDDVIDSFRSGEINLPPVPKVSRRFQEMLADNATFREFAELLQQDIAISSKLISVSNSALYRGAEENKTLSQAMNRLGLKTTQHYVDAICNKALYSSSNPALSAYLQKLWMHSLAVAFIAQKCVEKKKLAISCDPFTLGLLHDIGKSLLLNVIAGMDVKERFGEDFTFEQIFDGLDEYHDEIGAALFKRWKFSDVFGDVSMYHDEPEKAEKISTELDLIVFANALANATGFSLRGETEDQDLLELPAVKRLKLTEDEIGEIIEAAETCVDETRGVFD